MCEGYTRARGLELLFYVFPSAWKKRENWKRTWFIINRKHYVIDLKIKKQMLIKACWSLCVRGQEFLMMQCALSRNWIQKPFHMCYDCSCSKLPHKQVSSDCWVPTSLLRSRSLWAATRLTDLDSISSIQSDAVQGSKIGDRSLWLWDTWWSWGSTQGLLEEKNPQCKD